jgi:dipeptidyl aminopeptidase/acylaminoacyl peptidase
VTFGALAIACSAGAFFFLRRVHSDPLSFQSLTFRREKISNARFAPDGKTVIYDSTEDGVKYHIYSVQPGNPERRDLGIDAKLLDVSSTGQMVVLNASGELQSAPVGGGAPRTIAESVSLAAWSPDGKKLAIGRTIDGRDRLEYPAGKVLYQSPGEIGNLRISRDGQTVYLEEHPLKDDAAGFVRMIDSAGRTACLSPHYSFLHGLSLPKDGDGVLYTAVTEGLEVSLYLVTRSGHVRRITGFSDEAELLEVNAAGEMLLNRVSYRWLMFVSESPSSRARDLSWHDDSSPADFSADGKSVLFLEGGAASGTDLELYLRGTDGGPAIHLGTGAGTSLSSDGHWALVTKNQLPAQLFLLPTGAGQARQVTFDSLHHEDAAFLPDGQSMVFVGDAPGRPRMWYAQDLKGGPPRAFGPEGVSFAHFDPVVLSPDGRNIALVTTDKNVLLQPIAGGVGQAIPGVKAGYTPVRWCPGGATIMLQKKDGAAMQILGTNVTTGAQRLWKSIAPPEGLALPEVRSVRIAPDCQSLAWSVTTHEYRLFLVKGLGF